MTKPTARHYAALALGVVTLATSVLFVKASAQPVALLAGARLMLAATMLWPFKKLALGEPLRITRGDWLVALPGGVLLALHFITWFVGVRATSTANSVLIINLQPAFMPFVMLAVRGGERVNAREAAGSVIALCGVATLAVWGNRAGTPHVYGDLMCVASVLLVTVYMARARTAIAGRSLLAYLVPLYYVAGATCLVYAVVAGELKRAVISWHEAWMAVGLAVVPTVLGHSLLNYCMTRLRGQVVTTANLGQVFVAAVAAWLLYRELPVPAFYPASVLIAAGALVVVSSAPRTVARATARAEVETS